MLCLPLTLSTGSRCNAHTLRPIHTELTRKQFFQFLIQCEQTLTRIALHTN